MANNENQQVIESLLKQFLNNVVKNYLVTSIPCNEIKKGSLKRIKFGKTFLN